MKIGNEGYMISKLSTVSKMSREARRKSFRRRAWAGAVLQIQTTLEDYWI